MRTRAVLLAASVLGLSALHAQADFSFTLLHSNDMESALLPSNAGAINYGGAAAWAALNKKLQTEAATNGVLTISAGDGWLPGIRLDASTTRPDPFPWFDAMAHRAAGIQAYTLGNHEFDRGPQGVKDYVHSLSAPVQPGVPAGAFPAYNGPVLTQVNLFSEPDYSAAPNPLDPAKVAKSLVLNTGGQQVGIIGLTTPLIPNISSPGNVTFPGGLTLADAASAVNAEAAALASQGVNKIILSGHLQDIRNDSTSSPCSPASISSSPPAATKIWPPSTPPPSPSLPTTPPTPSSSPVETDPSPISSTARPSRT